MPARIVSITNSTGTAVIAVISEDPERLRCIGKGVGAKGAGAGVRVEGKAQWEASGVAPAQRITIAPHRTSKVRIKSATVYATLCVRAPPRDGTGASGTSGGGNMWRVVMEDRMLDDYSVLNIMEHHLVDALKIVRVLP